MKSKRLPSGFSGWQQRGVALFVTLVFLGIVAVLGMATVRTGVMGFWMASNTQARIEAFQLAQSVVESVAADAGSTVVAHRVGYTTCTRGGSSNLCSAYSLTIPDALAGVVDGVGTVTAQVTRLAPLLGPPPRGTGYSLGGFKAANFRIVGVREGDNGRGSAKVIQGTLVLVPVRRQVLYQ